MANGCPSCDDFNDLPSPFLYFDSNAQQVFLAHLSKIFKFVDFYGSTKRVIIPNIPMHWANGRAKTTGKEKPNNKRHRLNVRWLGFSVDPNKITETTTTRIKN